MGRNVGKRNATTTPWILKDTITGRFGGNLVILGGAQSRRSVVAFSTDDTREEPIEQERANARRIVACVNACAEITDPSVIPELIQEVRYALEGWSNGAGDERGDVSRITALLERVDGKKRNNAKRSHKKTDGIESLKGIQS